MAEEIKVHNAICSPVRPGIYKVLLFNVEIGIIRRSSGQQSEQWFAQRSGNHYGPFKTVDDAAYFLINLWK